VSFSFAWNSFTLTDNLQSGYNTANVMSVLPELFAPPSCNKIDYLLILFGANDACLPSSPTRQHVPIEKYRENLQAIINHPSVTAHSPTILLVTPVRCFSPFTLHLVGSKDNSVPRR
jgi:lysophospholipase L1-like esterase